MIEITNEQLTKISKLYEDFVDLEDPIELNEETGIYSCYAFTFGPIVDEESGEKTDELWISFNDDVPTSTLLNICNFIVPLLEDSLSTFIHIVKCHAPIYKKKGGLMALSEMVYDDMYEKVIKKITPAAKQTKE